MKFDKLLVLELKWK